MTAPTTIIIATALLALTACTKEPAVQEATSSDAPATTQAGAKTAAPAPAAAMTKVNLNDATREQFLALPGVGERMAHEFDEYRPYVSIQQFRRDIGKYVDAEQVAAYEQHVYVPVDPNACDSETLQQLPGVTAEVAEALIAKRPFSSTDAFVEALAAHVDSGQLALGRQYLLAP